MTIAILYLACKKVGLEYDFLLFGYTILLLITGTKQYFLFETIFFGMGSPSWFNENVAIVRLITEAIYDNRIKGVDKFKVRVHPVHVIRQDKNRQILELFDIQRMYPDILTVVQPTMKPLDFGYDFSERDLIDLIECISSSDVLITQFSTLMLEAAILEKPIVNIGFDKIRQINMTSGNACTKETHIEWILSYKFTKIANSRTDLINMVNKYIKKPLTDADNRLKVSNEVCSVNRGCSGRAVSDYLLDLISSNT